jgi:hypothetical protein
MPFQKGQSGNPKGRPRTQDKYAGVVSRGERQIADRLPLLIEKMFELAEGVLVEDINPILGTKSVYQKAPDRPAIEYLVNRIMGKPTERTDLNVSSDEWVFDPTETNNPPPTNGKAAPVLDE